MLLTKNTKTEVQHKKSDHRKQSKHNRFALKRQETSPTILQRTTVNKYNCLPRDSMLVKEIQRIIKTNTSCLSTKRVVCKTHNINK